MNETQDLTHFSPAGRARMVDVGGKENSERLAVARGCIRMQAATLERIQSGRIAKGDVLAVADVAAVMAAKRTSDLIPLCHPLALSRVAIELEAARADGAGAAAVLCTATVETTGPTGVEMEALTAVQVALLTIYDMCKAADRGMVMTGVRLLQKHGGKSGSYVAG